MNSGADESPSFFCRPGHAPRTQRIALCGTVHVLWLLRPVRHALADHGTANDTSPQAKVHALTIILEGHVTS
jgi:hypothetical protein